ncbi:ATP-binding protein [Sediminicurvatus halobius]|uniref:AAA family ATPase n=1 Tax=Sediminicurvatus halobius TaxID=2182432 RepID=A0A2U2MVS8_9GAMM|nr:ATP-binding protein [Spiribacter halobius]PWG60963.1 AAA family ATPase [Spiribacter halobius]UEX78666.1 ATP-binding protein [Spiribacter halobius]
MTALDDLARRLEALLDRVEPLIPDTDPAPDWGAGVAFRWRRRTGGSRLEPLPRTHHIRLADLQHIDRQKAEVDRNTRQFLAGLPANNVLLSGSRGTGKSSLVKALLTEYAGQGLRLIEVEAHDLIDLPEIVGLVHQRPERFVLFCDDLSFEADDPSYKALKAVLDGSVAAPPDNLILYATSNRRHLLPEYMSDNEQARNVDGEIHHGEAVEERISLSERFGLWLSFYPFDQQRYLDICFAWLAQLGAEAHPEDEQVRRAALQFALARGSRSGRVAWQFARDWAGRQGLT